MTAGAVFTASKSDDEILQRANQRPAMYASLYTVDGQFSAGANATKGREALKSMISGTPQRQASAQQAARRPPMD